MMNNQDGKMLPMDDEKTKMARCFRWMMKNQDGEMLPMDDEKPRWRNAADG